MVEQRNGECEREDYLENEDGLLPLKEKNI